MNVLSLCGPESGLPKNPSVSGDGGLLWFSNSSEYSKSKVRVAYLGYHLEYCFLL